MQEAPASGEKSKLSRKLSNGKETPSHLP